MTPIVFEGCFGWLHGAPHPLSALGAPGGRGVVVCAPVGQEMIWTHRALRALAITLAEAGLPCLRFDYHGTGDSAGDDAEPERVRAWLDSVAAAARALRVGAGVGEVALIGVRLGALLAWRAAEGIAGVESLVLVAPPPSGKGFEAELAVLARMARGTTRVPMGACEAESEMEAGGFLITAQTRRDLTLLTPGRVTATEAGPAPAFRRVLLLEAPGRPSVEVLARGLAAAGALVTREPLSEVAAFLKTGGALAASSRRRLVDWLGEGMGQGVREGITPGGWWRSEPPPHPAPPAAPAILALSGAEERALLLDGAPSLFGILSWPMALAPARPAVLFLNAGITHHIGSNRVWVMAARRLAGIGVASLRLDFAGIGDSASRPGAPDGRMYAEAAITDVTRALDRLEAEGRARVVVVGLCAGAAVALHAARDDLRVVGLVLVNPGRFFLGPGETPEMVARTDQVRRAETYIKTLARWRTWAGLLAFERHAWSVIFGLARRSVARLFSNGRRDEVAGWFRGLSRRGVGVWFVHSEDDFTLAELDARLGRDGRKLKGLANVRFERIADTDHSLARRAARERLAGIIEAAVVRQAGVTGGRGADDAPARPAPRRLRRLVGFGSGS